jgi:hypothetical protein
MLKSAHFAAAQHTFMLFTFCSKIGASPQLTMYSGKLSIHKMRFSKTIFAFGAFTFCSKIGASGCCDAASYAALRRGG